MASATPLCDLGLIGLGTMGRNLALNIMDHGFRLAVYNRTPAKTQEFLAAAAGRPLAAASDLQEFIRQLQKPRTILLLVAAGPPVDEIIAALRPHLEPGDLLIDAGNSFFRDTDRRLRELATAGLLFLGLGVSGGEVGARYGPSLMPGGPREAFARLQPLLEAIAAKVGGEPCVGYVGQGAAGHYVKMVHNGIEYGLMQLLAEAYDLLRFGLGLDHDALHRVFAQWNREELASYLVEITAGIFLQPDDRTGGRLLDAILDVAGDKGTGVWTSQEAMDLRVPVPNIDAAVSLRALSGLKGERQAAAAVFPGSTSHPSLAGPDFPGRLKPALLAGMIITFAQGLALLRTASQRYGYELQLPQVAKIWRGGCIIRAALLEDLYAALQDEPELPNLLLSARLRPQLVAACPRLQEVVAAASLAGFPVPGLAAALNYFQAYRRAQLPVNLIQAQRDWFGAHTYERLDAPGRFHTHWQQLTAPDR